MCNVCGHIDTLEQRIKECFWKIIVWKKFILNIFARITRQQQNTFDIDRVFLMPIYGYFPKKKKFCCGWRPILWTLCYLKGKLIVRKYMLTHCYFELVARLKERGMILRDYNFITVKCSCWLLLSGVP